MAWTANYTITVDHTKVPNTDQTNFAVVFWGRFLDLRTTANGGLATSASGFDVIFAADSAGATPYSFERVSWDAKTGICEFWVLIPTLSHTVDTTFYILVGNSAITTDQQSASAVWDSNYKSVYHQTSLGTDSTSNAVNATSSSGVSSSAGVVGSAAQMVNGYQSFGDKNDITGTAISVEAWVNRTNAGSYTILAARDGVSGGVPLQYSFAWVKNNEGTFNNALRLDITNSSGSLITANSTGRFTDTGVWHHVAITFDGSNCRFYWDGSLDSTIAMSGSIGGGHTGWVFTIGTDRPRAVDDANTLFDENRLSASVRSGDYIKATYNNQSSPRTFWSTTLPSMDVEVTQIGREVVVGGPPTGRITQLSREVLIGGSNVMVTLIGREVIIPNLVAVQQPISFIVT